MPARRVALLLTLLLLSTAVGCSTERHSYDVAVENQFSKPITFWLVKDHADAKDRIEMEDGWLSPEDVGMLQSPPPDKKMPQVVVPPGKTATTPKPISGTFEKGRDHATLRVYSGTPSLSETLAIDRGSLDRLDIPLEPGRTRIVIRDKHGFMDATVTNLSDEH
jgi:hypothetical protein